MVNMLNEMLISETGRQNIGKNIPAPAFQKKSINTASVQLSEEVNGWTRSVLPAGIMGGGALLMYLGFRTPNISKKIHMLYRRKISDMTHEVIQYKSYAADYLDKEYKKVLPYIKGYKEEHTFEYLGHTAKIQDAKDGSEILEAVDEGFAAMREIQAKDIKPGVSGMDEFKNFMYSINHPAYNHLTDVRNGTLLKLLDYSLMPRFKNGSHKEEILKAEEKLGIIKGRADKKLFDTQNNLTDEHINRSSKHMARIILKSRREIPNAMETIMDYAFAKFGKIYNLEEEIKPLFRTGRTMKTFASLTPDSLKPQILSEKMSNMLNNQYLTRVLGEVDFNNLDEKTVKSLFNTMPVDFDTRQIDMITDRLRLQQAVNKAQGAGEDTELHTVSAKLECLAENLVIYGKAKLIERCNENLTGINNKQLHAKVYYINYAARKIGLTGIEDADKFMIKHCPEYPDSTFKQYVREILAHPEHYFM